MLATGTLLGDYEVIKPVGRSGIATVYQAYHARLDRNVVLKVFHPALAQAEDFLTRFEHEVRGIARLDHPHILPIYDFGEHAGSPYLVMKHVAGQTLADRLAQGAIPLREVSRILRPVAEALVYALQQDILHRDIRPAAIVLAENGSVILADFGLSGLLPADSAALGQGVGASPPHYLAPEQVLGKPLDTRADLYALGVVLYELVVGRVPYTGETPFVIMHAHLEAPLPAPRKINPNVPPAVEKVLIRALAKDPADRYPSALALVDAFEAALEGAAATRPPAARSYPPEEHRPPWQKTRRASKQEFELDFGDVDWEDLGEALEDRVEQWSDALQDWVEQFGDRFKDQAPVRRRRSKAPLTPEEELRRKIEKRLKEQQEFRTHLVIFILVNLMLWMLWLVTGTGFPWPLFPTLGWGVGIVAHYMDYNHKYGAGAERRERLIQQKMEEARLSGQLPYASGKRKNEDLVSLEDQVLRLGDDGELSDSFIQHILDDEKPKRSRRE